MRITDPNTPIIFDRTESELQENLLFCIVVAGKKASVQIKLLHTFLNYISSDASPFEKIKQMDESGTLITNLQESKIGQYTRLALCFRELVNSGLNLSTCTVEDLENIHGIGPKTARFFMTSNRQNVRHAVIDTHLIKFLKQHLGVTTASATPGNRKEYSRLETVYLDYVDGINVNPAELDLAIWKMYSSQDRVDFDRLTKNPQIAIVG